MTLTLGQASLLFSSLVLVLNPIGAVERRDTQFSGISSGIRRSGKLTTVDGNDLHVGTMSTSSVTTTSTTAEEDEEDLAQILSVDIPGHVFHTHSSGAYDSILGVTSDVTISKPSGVYIRPEGALPVPTEHFGFDHPRPLHPGAVPNCGCVARGACLGEVGAYTRMVLTYTDVVCGHTFETCCFDGPWAGTYDSFAAAAACVPQAQCARPYGVLPTDVRDYGVIAPCPGQGAVRCLVVSDEELLVFQAAVAAIDAANAYNAHNSFHVVEPMHLLIPIVGKGKGSSGTTTVEATATATSSVTSQADANSAHHGNAPPPHQHHHPAKPTVVVHEPVPAGPSTVVVHPAAPAHPNVIVHAPPPAQPDIIVHQTAPPQPNIIIEPPPSAHPNIIVHPSAPAQPNIIVQPSAPVQPNIVVEPSSPVQPNIIVQPSAPAQPNIILQPYNPGGPNIISPPATPAQPNIVVHLPPPANINVEVNTGGTTFGHAKPPHHSSHSKPQPTPPIGPHGTGIIPLVVPPTTVVIPPVAPPAAVVPAPIPPPAVVIPPAAVSGYPGGYYYGATGYPWGGFGFGFGKGFSFRKHISINKGSFFYG